MKDKSLYALKTIFYLLIGFFILILTYFVVPVSDSLRRTFLPFIIGLVITFFLLGIVLIFLTLKKKIKGKLKKFLILTGISATGFFISIILHNFFYALAILTNQIIILKYLMEALHVVFFIISIPVCPILFLVGAIGSIILFIKKK